VDEKKLMRLQIEVIAFVFASNLSKGGKDGEVPCSISVAAGTEKAVAKRLPMRQKENGMVIWSERCHVCIYDCLL
jgi:hypothetical protein